MIKTLEKKLRDFPDGFSFQEAKKIINKINEAFCSNAFGFNEYKACKDAIINNLAQPEHYRIRLLNMFIY